VLGAKAGEYLAKNTPHRRPVGGGDNTYRGAAPRAEDTSELCQPEARVRKELQAELADDGVENTVPERQRLAVSGYRPKRWFSQPVARALKHRRRDVRTNHDTRSADGRKCHQRDLTRSGGDIENTGPWAYLRSGNYRRYEEARPSANPSVICRRINGTPRGNVETRPETGAH